MEHKNIYKYFAAILILSVMMILNACKHSIIPKPRAYFRIDFPEKEYTQYQSDCNYRFEYPVYGQITNLTVPSAEPCWINIGFPQFKGKIYITYKRINNNPATYSEDIRTLAYKHIIKADDIIETPVIIAERHVYGILYEIKGNTATSLNFYVTDSVSNFLSGAVYFNTVPNKDSLAPVISFFKTDIEHLIETLEWK
jgi:gliding motility-associated lipoprotein GldD